MPASYLGSGLVGTRAVVSNPHYKHFFSSIETDSLLGAVTDWPQQPALLLLDCFAPEDRPNILEQAAKHGHTVWVLRLDQPSRWAISDIRKLRELRAERVVDLPAKSLVHHNAQCWSAAQWDSQSSRYNSQFWLLRPPSDLVSPTLILMLCCNSWVPGTITDMISITIQNHPPIV